LKQFIFPHQLRPWKEWGQTDYIYLIKDFQPYNNNSFPSGHTTTVFCFFALIALLFPSRFTGAICFLLALLAAYSRIYLAQHLFIDTYAGAILGSLTTILFYAYFYRRQSGARKGLLDRSWLNLKG
jgi:membrane-associated phospholipid phosphatase